ncbi:DUF3990 domain-containing protein [Emergencia sp. 1XD21-10]|uniref:DUF3990 domain-containing protein n=1 Tax=Emergencia sp. 1XD21-10 TaxID=2304569 RepID=UPI00137B1A22|nr:DUF3990 domain-containing protein [Emergencia sp. 1XD21-10]NCE98341.1 DUF3990 domain-containing protein [Emergencia sp. 1XD21-10]
MIIYHGSSIAIEKPDIEHSFRSLDFGKGFYTTSVREQAERWARRKADILGQEKGIVNVYQMEEDSLGLLYKVFSEDLSEWIDFVCACRDCGNEYLQYDVIIGKVANDKVFRVVDMYQAGIWDKERALKEIKVYPTYDQIAFISQKSIDRLLSFESYYEV